MINTELNGTLDLESRTTYIGTHPMGVIHDMDILEKMQSNIEQLEELCAQLNFVMREVRTVMKI